MKAATKAVCRPRRQTAEIIRLKAEGVSGLRLVSAGCTSAVSGSDQDPRLTSRAKRNPDAKDGGARGSRNEGCMGPHPRADNCLHRVLVRVTTFNRACAANVQSRLGSLATGPEGQTLEPVARCGKDRWAYAKGRCRGKCTNPRRLSPPPAPLPLLAPRPTASVNGQRGTL